MLRGIGRGDLYVTLNIEVPKKLTENSARCCWILRIRWRAESQRKTALERSFIRKNEKGPKGPFYVRKILPAQNRTGS